jgi:hypothetical protein
MSDRTQDWVGKSSDLFDLLETQAEKLKLKKGFPKSPNWLWRKIKDVRPNLMAYGLEVTKSRDLTGSVITISKHAANVASAKPTSDYHPINNGNNDSIDNKNDEKMEELVRETLF